ncbi:unnamed protein product, partial [Prorocentrum cordatum]
YFAGLCATMVALMLMRMGQPALLYLVPGTLGTTVALAARRGELPLLWSGASCGRDSEPARCSHASQPYGRAEEEEATPLGAPEPKASDEPRTLGSPQL